MGCFSLQFLLLVSHPSEGKRMWSCDRQQMGNCERDLALEKQPTTASALRGGWASNRTCLRVDSAVCPSDMEPKRIREGYLVKRVSGSATDKGITEVRVGEDWCPALDSLATHSRNVLCWTYWADPGEHDDLQSVGREASTRSTAFCFLKVN